MVNHLSRRIVGEPGPQPGGSGSGTSASQSGGGDISSPVLPCERGKPEKQPVRIRASLFYDGTGNNRVNVGLGSEYSSDDSYANGLSNIARLEYTGLDGVGPTMDEHFTVYTEGIGTTDRESDSNVGMALGTGGTGIPAKVERGINEAISQIRSIMSSYSRIEQLHIDTFGFSRGAAAARHCVWKCMQEAGKTLKARLEGLGVQVGEVVVKFVGLYDTVASYGMRHSNDTAELHLDAISIAEKVVQLAAAEEHRVNFRLTNIRSAGGKGREIFLPGVHSDVGGGYADTEDEVDWQLFDLDVAWLNAKEKAAITRERQWLVASGWYRADELAPTNFWNEVKATRRDISNDYSCIPLRLMAEFARENGVPLSVALEVQNPLSDALATANSEIRAYIARGGRSSPGDWFRTNPALDPPWHVALRHDYLHFSARYGTMLGANAPQWSDGGPVEGRRMRIIQDG